MLKEIANRYTLISLIGQGGMADVYKALDTILNRIVAVKVLRAKVSDDPMILVRFQREASAASKLSHPNIIDIYDVGEYKGTHYIVMEFVRGRTLKELIAQRGAMAPEEAISIMRQLSAAVAHAHAHHIIHRDIKPQNVLIKDDGTVKITDFGIAVANDSVALTYHNTIMGSAHYLSPETAQGKEPNPAIDIYALGIVFYEMLTGDVPFKGKTPTEIALKHLRQPLPYPRSFNPNIPQSVENIVLKAAAKDPAERYENAASLVYDLDHCLDPEYKNIRRIEPKVKSLDMEPEPEKPDRTRRVLTILVAAAAVLALAIALLWASLHFGLLHLKRCGL
jgi:serine/threonine-protein kinase